MPEDDAIYVCTLGPEDDKATDVCPHCYHGKGPRHGVRRPITHDLFGVPTIHTPGRPVFDPRTTRP